MNKEYRVLDKGIVQLVTYSGGDSTVVDAARVSYQKGTKQVRDDKTLINYLVKNGHTTPTEMIDFTFKIKAPIFVCREWFRHRIGSFNELSLRYSEAPNDYYLPNHWRRQDTKNRQSSSGRLDSETEAVCNLLLEQAIESACVTYTHLLTQGVAREQARMVLPVNLYSVFYWKVNARSLANFIHLRSAPNAQFEIRAYTEPLKEIFEAIAPLTYEAYEQYVWNNINLMNTRALRDELNGVLGYIGEQAPKLFPELNSLLDSLEDKARATIP